VSFYLPPKLKALFGGKPLVFLVPGVQTQKACGKQYKEYFGSICPALLVCGLEVYHYVAWIIYITALSVRAEFAPCERANPKNNKNAADVGK
jgi:hypothetical protein